MKGYKVFNPDFTCREQQFAENTTYKFDGKIEICRSGFHFCIKAAHCFSYYDFDSRNIVCEVEAIGKVLTHDDDSKVCTDEIRIGRRLTWNEVLQVANDGKNNTGYSNTGNSNTGDWNTGNSNTGYRNTGYRNTGDWNTGDRNTGNSNTGYSNTGNSNTGDRNTGDWNTGYSNTGNSNTGYRNTGDWNTGYRNTGNSNTGDWNTGDRNTGYSNTGNSNTGVFCTGAKHLDFFNKKSTWTEKKFLQSKVYSLLCQIDTKMWIYSGNMTAEEKEKNPSHTTTGGYLKDIPYKESFQNAWHNWSDSNKNEFKSLPNFDSEIFFEITGVKIDSK